MSEHPFSALTGIRPGLQTPQLSRSQVQFFGTLVRVDHPELARRSQNILLEGTYFAIFPVEPVGANTWNRQFNTSAAYIFPSLPMAKKCPHANCPGACPGSPSAPTIFPFVSSSTIRSYPPSIIQTCWSALMKRP